MDEPLWHIAAFMTLKVSYVSVNFWLELIILILSSTFRKNFFYLEL